MSLPLAWLETLESKGMIATVIPPGPSLDCSEKEFQAAVIALAKERGWIVYHSTISKRSEPGWFDLCLIRERALFWELKTETGTLTKAQATWLAAALRAGLDAAVMRPRYWPQIVEILK